MYVLIVIAFVLSINKIGLMTLRVLYVGNGLMVLGMIMRYGAVTQ